MKPVVFLNILEKKISRLYFGQGLDYLLSQSGFNFQKAIEFTTYKASGAGLGVLAFAEVPDIVDEKKGEEILKNHASVNLLNLKYYH